MIEILKYIINNQWLLTYLFTTGLLSSLDFVIFNELKVKLKNKGYLINDEENSLKYKILTVVLMLIPGLNALATIYFSKILNEDKLLDEFIEDGKKMEVYMMIQNIKKIIISK